MQSGSEEWIKRYRSAAEVLTDACVWIISLLFVQALSYDLERRSFLTASFVELIAIAIGSHLIVGWIASLYRIRWKNASFEQTLALAATVANAALIVLVVNIFVLHHAVPTRNVVAAAAYTFLGCAGLRGAWRLNWEYRVQGLARPKRAIVFGAGDGGSQVIDALRSERSPFTPVALLDDSPSKRHVQIRDLRVTGGRHDIVAISEQVKADTLIVAIPSASSGLIRYLSDKATTAGLDIRVLPSTSELLPIASVGISDIRVVTEQDLLGRHEIQTDVDTIAGYLTGRRVLVTGAGGSIGSELCRQIHRFAPAELIKLDRDESGLQELQLSIEQKALLGERSLVVCNIQDVAALEAVFEEHRPEVVFHAAALKHLPLLEMWPAEALKTNVIGTWNVLTTSIKCGVSRLVNISTDKAADPCSVLGYTKRIGERLTATAATRADGAFLSVRFGNVLGSRGSVLTTFRAQIAAGGPVTVTHPDVTRYFMTVQEAVQLVVQAGAIGTNSEVLVLDMGSPARIAEVAKRLAEESDKPIEIIFTGLRPGEKLNEVLFGSDEADVRPRHPLISHVPVPAIDPRLIELINTAGTPEKIREDLRTLCGAPGATHPFQTDDAPPPDHATNSGIRAS
jgi:FlaA1/EpsC-like NDP-sugar epimerase